METHGIARAQGRFGRMRVRVVAGPDAGAAIRVDRPIVAGTSELCELRLSDRTVSRRHVVLEPAEGGVRVRDEDSKNGTYHGDTRIFDAELPPAAQIRIGESVLEFDVERFASESADQAMPDRFGRFLGRARCLAPIYAKLERAAASDATVLIEGESGSGKELLSEAIHEHSPRASAPFVVFDCGAVPESLIESELFGHEKGAFTGAEQRRIGAFEEAQGGTVFLDEIGELPLALQTRLLRVLDRKQIRRIGGNQQVDVDVRVIAATNRNLEREVEEGRFRADLFHRLAVVAIRVPPLRARLEDLELLALSFAAGFGRTSLPEELVARMKTHRWPGNARELRNYVERFCLLGEAGAPSGAAPAAASVSEPAPHDPLLDAARSGLPYRQAREKVLAAFTAAYVEDMLARNDDNVSRASRAAGIARRHFHRLKSAT
jgi:DNA-binding NtrC family response regulator